MSQFGEGGGDSFHHAVITVQVFVGKVDGRFGRVINAVAQRLFGVSPGGRSGSPAAVAIVEGHCHRGGGGRSAGRRYRRVGRRSRHCRCCRSVSDICLFHILFCLLHHQFDPFVAIKSLILPLTHSAEALDCQETFEPILDMTIGVNAMGG